MTIQPRAEALQRSRAECFATMTPDNQITRDGTVTPFLGALRLSGFKPVLHLSGCINACPCEKCHHTKFSFEHDSLRYWACPDCEAVHKQE